ncbi:MAG: S24 family peptidase [bacterium]
MLIAIKEKIELDESDLLIKLNPDPFKGLSVEKLLMFQSLNFYFSICSDYSVTEVNMPFFKAVVETDKMEPVIEHGDIITVDTSDKEYKEGEIYAVVKKFGDNEKILSFEIARVHYCDGIAILKWDNTTGDVPGDKNYEALRCDDLNEIILGRVLIY